jgi:hypothetical protein
MQAHELFIRVEISLAGTGEQYGFALGRRGQNCKLYTVDGGRVPASARYATSALKARPRSSKSAN